MLITKPGAIGLTDKEAQIYETLVNVGEVDAARIILETDYKRPTVYKSLGALIRKGLVEEKQVNGVSRFRANPPEKLMELTGKRLEAISRARTELTDIIPLLTSTYLLSTEKPIVNVYEGMKGIKEVFKDTLKEGKEILAVVQDGKVEPDLAKWLDEFYVQERVRLQIPAKVIVAAGQGNMSYISKDEQHLRTTILVPGDQFPFKHEMNIYGDKLAFINYVEGDALLAVVINHPKVAGTMRDLFKLAWEGAKTVRQESTTSQSESTYNQSADVQT